MDGSRTSGNTTARFYELVPIVDAIHSDDDQSSHVLKHPDGTIARIDPFGIMWITPDGKEIRDKLLWPPRTYAARLCRLGFMRQRQ